MTMLYWVIADFSGILYVTLLPWPVWSTLVPSLKCIQLNHSRVSATTMFYWQWLKVPILRFLRVNCINFKLFIMAKTTYDNVGMRPKMWSVAMAKEQKRKDTFVRQTGYLPRPPTSTYPHLPACGVVSRRYISYIFQVSWKSVEGSPSCGGSKSAICHWLGPWLIQQLVLPCKLWYVNQKAMNRLQQNFACSLLSTM